MGAVPSESSFSHVPTLFCGKALASSEVGLMGRNLPFCISCGTERSEWNSWKRHQNWNGCTFLEQALAGEKFLFQKSPHRTLYGSLHWDLLSASMAGRSNPLHQKKFSALHSTSRFLMTKTCKNYVSQSPFMSSLFACGDVFFPWTFMPIKFQQILDWSVISHHPWSSLVNPLGCFFVTKGVVVVEPTHLKKYARQIGPFFRGLGCK